MAFFISSIAIPREIPSLPWIPGFIYTGVTPVIIKEFIADLCTFLGIIILSPSLQTLIIMACTADVVPLTMKNALSALKASAANSSASFITEVGWQRLSKGFIEFTSTETQSSPKNSLNSVFPLPCLWPGTSKGTILWFLYHFNAS